MAVSFSFLNSRNVFVYIFLHLFVGFTGSIPDCSSTKECMPYQRCVHGYCHCEEGYIELYYTCFKVRSHGEDCFFDEQCPDHRMSCRREANSTLNVKYCLCDKYHPWDDTVNECVPAEHIKLMIAALLEKFDVGKVITDEANNVFYFIKIAAFVVIALGTLLAAGCVAYGCCSCAWYLSKKERWSAVENPWQK